MLSTLRYVIISSLVQEREYETKKDGYVRVRMYASETNLSI